MESRSTRNLLVIGASGGLARILCKHILQTQPNWNIVGVDSRPMLGAFKHERFKFFRIKYSRGQFENIFRDHSLDTVLHLARVTHSNQSQRVLKERLNLNLMGTKTILELCLKHDLKKVVILSTFHVYGALSDNSVFLDEDSPLRASLQYADMRDVVEMDQICTNWMWKNQNDINTIILRPSNIIGPNIHNAISNFLTANTNIYPLDFNPIFQFIYEWDMIRILFRTLGHFETGVYNVATDDTISLRDTLKLTSARNIPISLFALQYLNRTFQRLTHIPEYLFDYLKYSCLISNDNIKRHLETDFFKYKAEQSLKMLGR